MLAVCGAAVLAVGSAAAGALRAVPAQAVFYGDSEAAGDIEPAIVVAVDPGHGGYNANVGGEDTGCSGSGYTEPDVTYPTAQALVDLLTADGRFAPVMTTDGSTYRKGSERAAASNAAQAQLLLAIHCNADPDPDTHGFECYANTPAQATNADSLRFAGLIARGFADNGASLRGETGVRYLYFHGDNDERRVFEASDTTVNTDPTFGVLQYSDCPAVLVEEFFLTNSADAAAYAGEEGCRTAAQIYYEAICAYFDLEPR